VIRPGRTIDLPALEEIERAWKTTPGWTRGQFEEELRRPDAVVFVGQEEDFVVGVGVLRLGAGEAHLLDLAVRPGWTGRGIGSKILAALVGEARGRGASKVSLEVQDGNARALAVYQAAGFVEVGRRKGFYGPGLDALLMDLALG